MSNRAFATRYNGSSSVGGGGGGADLFGLQNKRQKDLIAIQQANELEKIKAQAAADKDVTSSEYQNKGDYDARQVGLAAAKANGMVPPNTSFNDLSKEQQDAINEYGMTHLKLQQKIQDDPEFQKASVSGAASLQAKPTFENNESAARARQLSNISEGPNTVSSFWPSGSPSNQPEIGKGPTQTINMTGGMKDTNPKSPTYEQMIFQKPVETYGNGSFTSVGKINLGDSQNLTNNIQTKPTDSNVSPAPTSSQFDNPQLDAILNQHPQQPSITPTPSPVATKPTPGMIDPTSPGPASILSLLKFLQSTNNPGIFQGGNVTPTTF